MGVHIWTPRIEEDGIWDALQPWSNTRPWSDTSPEPLDVLVVSVTETKEVLPLVERFRQGQPGKPPGKLGQLSGKNYEKPRFRSILDWYRPV